MPARCCSCRRKPIFLLAFDRILEAVYFPTSMDTVSNQVDTVGEQLVIVTTHARFSCALSGGQG